MESNQQEPQESPEDIDRVILEKITLNEARTAAMKMMLDQLKGNPKSDDDDKEE